MDFILIGMYASLGIFIGGLSFIAGSFLVSQEPHEHIKKSLLNAQRTVRMSFVEIAYQSGLAGCKELVWRVFLIAALTQLLPVWICVVIATVLFWLFHEESWPLSEQSIELFQFSLAMTMAYAYTGSLVLVWCAHMVRVILTMSATESALLSEQNT